MRKLINYTGLLLVVLPAFFTSCEKDKPLSELMIGKWDARYVTTFYYQNSVLKEESKVYLDAGTITIQLVAGGTGIYSESNNDYLFSWTLNGSSLSITNLSIEPEVWDLKMDGDNLVWSWPMQTSAQDQTVTYTNVFTGQRIN